MKREITIFISLAIVLFILFVIFDYAMSNSLKLGNNALQAIIQAIITLAIIRFLMWGFKPEKKPK